MIPHLKIDKSDDDVKREQRQAKLAALADKKKADKPLTLDDLDAKLDIILEQQEEILQRLTAHSG